MSLIHIKVLNQWINKLFTQFLQLLRKSYPATNWILEKHYNAKAKLKCFFFGMGYEMIHVCVNDYALFLKDQRGQKEDFAKDITVFSLEADFCFVCIAPF